MATSKIYGNFMMQVLAGNVKWSADTIKVALYTSAASAAVTNQDASVYKDVALTANEVAAGNGYTTGGATLANKTITYDTATNTVKLDADDTVWAASTITAQYAVIYDDTPASNKPLIAYVDFESAQSSLNGDFRVQWDAAGILTLSTGA